ncbi:class I SAM-dependent methyltransferase [Arenibaculum pallidiluteum]|uniref:class I SAM-dependent methyltransferase n=1 Tax=Arenibaculum pallidiluteum TaxID=2812559 RepID=UPI001A96553C|nr:methyltransferase domain-containing protein [Arenibaculum pallidiluteum]
MSDRAGGIWGHGDAYEAYVGRWSRVAAVEFLRWLDLPPGLRWLDVGSGTGALSRTILDRCRPAAVTGIDPSEGFVRHARERQADHRAAFLIGDARSLPVGHCAFDAAVSGLVLNFVPDAAAAAAEMRRAVRPRGIVAAYVWDYADGMRMMRCFWDAAVALDPSARALDEKARSPLCHPDRLNALFVGAGLVGVEVRAIEVPMVFKDFEDYWSPFLGGQGPAPAYCMSLPPERRQALRDRLSGVLARGPGGTIAMTARAWAVRGRREDQQHVDAAVVS